MRARPLLLRHTLPIVGVAFALWSLLPPYSGPALNTETRVEVADHVVPAVLLLVVSVAGLALTAQPLPRQATLLLAGGFLILLAGIWMTATHIPLVAQASRQEVTWEAALYHTAPGVAVVVFGVLWVVRHWSEAPS